MELRKLEILAQDLCSNENIRNRIFVGKTIDFPLISTKDKIIITVEDSKKNFNFGYSYFSILDIN
jgi:hypothetical protein